jgi:drug/metabolite transporter (DMT)-like permease
MGNGPAATGTAILCRCAEREAGLKESYKRKSSIALGIVVIALLSIMETWVIDHRMPNPASPIVWSVLGATAAIAFGFFCWFRAKANQAPD